METLQEIKEKHAKELGYESFEELFSEARHTGVDACVDLIAIKFANHKLQEASEKATTIPQHVYGTEHESVEVIDKSSILKLQMTLEL